MISGRQDFQLLAAIDFDESHNHIQKVIYQDNLPDFDIDWYFKLRSDDVENSQSVAYILKDFAIKSSNWGYEKEWRVARKNKGYFHFKPEQVKAIYLGINCIFDIEKIIIMLLSYTNDDTPIYKNVVINKPF
ncbi:MAG: DUF2971 domain-containing protein [Saprospiraceae bacterium]|nr:DUF2971 domain-containing protein [Saprospiraceae bacterium]